jgi:gluconate 2-dehydrogenase subunit 3-like protein
MSKRLGRRAFVGGAVKLALAAGLAPQVAPAAGRAGGPRLALADRRRLRAAVDTIIPAEGRMPSASAVGGVAYLEGMAARDAAFGTLLVSGLRALDARSREVRRRGFAESTATQQAEYIAHLEKSDAPAGFVAALRDAVYEAYYSNPEVWKLIGYRFRSGPRRTATLDPFDSQRVARVRAMGRLYRETT